MKVSNCCGSPATVDGMEETEICSECGEHCEYVEENEEEDEEEEING